MVSARLKAYVINVTIETAELAAEPGVNSQAAWPWKPASMRIALSLPNLMLIKLILQPRDKLKLLLPNPNQINHDESTLTCAHAACQHPLKPRVKLIILKS
jgi:hypothetical protein